MLVWPILKNLKSFHSPQKLWGAFKNLCPHISPTLYMSPASFLTYCKAKIIFALVLLPSSFPWLSPFFGDQSDSSHFLQRIQCILSSSVILSPPPIQHVRSQLSYRSQVYLNQRIWNTKRMANCKLYYEAKTCRTEVPMLAQWCLSEDYFKLFCVTVT